MGASTPGGSKWAEGRIGEQSVDGPPLLGEGEEEIADCHRCPEFGVREDLGDCGLKIPRCLE